MWQRTYPMPVKPVLNLVTRAEFLLGTYSVQVGALSRALGVDVVSTNFIRLNVERLTDVAEEL